MPADAGTSPGGLFDLTGKVAVVTGASEGGLGHWSAVALARHGATVVVSDIAERAEALDSTVAAVGRLGGAVAQHYADVTSEEQVTELAQTTLAEFGRVDILVHHAGVILRKPTLDTSLAEWDRVLTVNLTGTFLTDRAFARPMLEQGSGMIVNTSSIYTNIVGPIPEAAYFASKGGVANLTRGLAAEWGRDGVNVNCVAPGFFYPTQITRPLQSDPSRLQAMADRTMLGRVGDPEKDLAGAVVWLASDSAKYVTGQVIFVDGGWSAQ